MMTSLRKPFLLTSLTSALLFSGALFAEVPIEEPQEKAKEERCAMILSTVTFPEVPGEDSEDKKEEHPSLFLCSDSTSETSSEDSEGKKEEHPSLFLCSDSTSEISSEDPQDRPKDEHIAVGSRPMDPEKLARIEEQKLQRSYELEDPTAPPTAELFFGASNALYQNDGKPAFRLATAEVTPPPVTLTAGFPVSCHWISWKSNDFRYIKIEDGSTWEIASGDYATISGWGEEPLEITPITNWFIPQHFYVTNMVNKTYVRANLVDGPVAFGPYSHWITGVDLVQGHIFLENQSVWRVDPQDLYILADRRNNNSEWTTNDHIIIIHSKNKYMLVNVNMNAKVHATLY